MRLPDHSGFKQRFDLSQDPAKRVLRENVVDATLRYLFVNTRLSRLYIVDLDAVITCDKCLHPVVFIEATCEKGKLKSCSITAASAARLDHLIAPSAACVLQIWDYEDCNTNFTPKRVSVYWVYLPAKYRESGYPPVRHFTYDEFKAYMLKVVELLHPPEVCAEIQAKNEFLICDIINKVELASKWEGNEHEI
jgi:hypothetical protein